MATAPRFVIESFGIIILSAVALVISIYGSSNQSAIAQLGAIAIGMQRMLPLMQLIYAGSSQIKGGAKIVSDLIDTIQETVPHEYTLESRRLNFNRRFDLVNIKYAIDERKEVLFDKINLTVKKGQVIGLIGKTGCGKSTLTDIISTLIQPTGGFLKVDGIRLTDKNIRAWKNRIAFVPQEIFLINGSIRDNITFGEVLNSAGEEKLLQVCKDAALDDFLIKLPNGLDTQVGERGCNISGGQKQRIGIARALFSENRDLIILDEATSALTL